VEVANLIEHNHPKKKNSYCSTRSVTYCDSLKVEKLFMCMKFEAFPLYVGLLGLYAV